MLLKKGSKTRLQRRLSVSAYSRTYATHALEGIRQEEEDLERACCHEVDAAEGREVDGKVEGIAEVVYYGLVQRAYSCPHCVHQDTLQNTGEFVPNLDSLVPASKIL